MCVCVCVLSLSLCSHSIPLGSSSFYASGRSSAAASVREKLQLSKDEIKFFPRFEQRTLKKKEDETHKRKRKFNLITKGRKMRIDEEEEEIESTTTTHNTRLPPTKKSRNHHFAPNTIKVERESSSVKVDPSSHPSTVAGVAEPPPPTNRHFLSGPPLPHDVIPYLTTSSEWRVFWPLVSGAGRQLTPLRLFGRPPAQHLHFDPGDWREGEQPMAAIQHGTPYRPEFTLERVTLMQQHTPHVWRCKLIYRTEREAADAAARQENAAAAAASASHTSHPTHTRHLSVTSAPRSCPVSVPPVSMVCALVPLCFLYKPSQLPCPVHDSHHCSAPEEAE